MKRSIKTALAIALVALAVPTAALATRHDGRSRGRHQQQFQTGQSGTNGSGTTVGSFDSSSGTLTLALANGGSVTGSVGFGTHIVCLGDWRQFFFHRHGRGRRYTTLTRGGYQHGSTGSSGNTGSSGSTGSSGNQGSGQGGHQHQHGYGGTGTQGSGQGYDRHRSHHYDNSGPPQQERCDSSLLVHGVAIQSASLEITSRGAQFGEIVLLPAVQ